MIPEDPHLTYALIALFILGAIAVMLRAYVNVRSTKKIRPDYEPGRCEVKSCKYTDKKWNHGIFGYRGHEICYLCWERHLDVNDSFDLDHEFDLPKETLGGKYDRAS